MRHLYEFVFGLQDRISGPLMEISRRFSSTVSNMQNMTNRFKSSFSSATQSVEELRRKLEQLKGRRDLMINTNDIKRANREIDVLQGKIDKLQNAGRSAGIGGFMGGLAREALPVMGAAAVVAGAGSFFGAGIKAEQTQMAYEQFAGPKAAQLIEQQNHFADITPFSNEEVLGAGRNMLSFGFKPEELLRHEKMVGDVAAGVQANYQELASIYGKLKSKGFADTGDLWQFADRGIPILDALSKTMGKSKEEILKMAETRQIKFTDLEKAFESLTSKGGLFYGMLDKLSNSIGGKLSTLIGTVGNRIAKLAVALNPVLGVILDIGSGLFAALDPLFVAIGELFKAFEPLFVSISKLLELFGITGAQAGVLSGIVTVLATAINAVAWVVNQLGLALQYLVEHPILLFIAEVGLVILNLGTLASWFAVVIGWIMSAFGWIVALAEGFWALTTAMLATPFGWVVAVVGTVIAAIVLAYEHIEVFRNALITVGEVAKSVLGAIGNAFQALMRGDFSGVAKAFSDAWSQGMKNAEGAIKADRATRAAKEAIGKAPQAPTLAKPEMPKAPGAGGGKDGKASPGKAGGLDATTGGSKSTTINITISKLVDKVTIHAASVGEGIGDLETQMTDMFLRVVNSANAMDT